MCTEWSGIHTYDEINDRLFVNLGRNDNIQDTKLAELTRVLAVDEANRIHVAIPGWTDAIQIKMEDTLAETLSK